MLGPCVARHTSYLWRCTFLVRIGIGRSQLWLLAITSDVEAVQFDEHRLTNRECAIETTLTNADSNGTCVVLDIETVIDVATYVVTSHDTLNLHRLRNLCQAVVIDFVRIERLYLSNGLEIGGLNVLIAVRCHSVFGRRSIPVAFHTRCGQS